MNQSALHFTSRQDVSNDDMIAVARHADALGYHSFWTGESWGRDAFTILTMLACNTSSLKLATGIVPVFSRSPGLIAQSIASLDQISQGRAILGLGTSGRAVIENWHGVPFRQPLQR
ncbi:MAG: LLM class flavin-dependent oxidoreductase, partial [Dehalococcoidia bacterium]